VRRERAVVGLVVDAPAQHRVVDLDGGRRFGRGRRRRFVRGRPGRGRLRGLRGRGRGRRGSRRRSGLIGGGGGGGGAGSGGRRGGRGRRRAGGFGPGGRSDQPEQRDGVEHHAGDRDGRAERA